jgi:glycosyltransferase involved in cell wall biosynthesis
MASALLRLIDNPELAERLRANGLADVEQYTWPNVRERLFSIYRSAGVARAATGETA